MAVLVTGGGGYIGSVTVDLLRERGEEVVVLDDVVKGHRAAVDPVVPFYQGRVGDGALLARIAGEHSLESCIHFAALAEVAESVREPDRYYQGNVAQGLSLLESLRGVGVRRMVFSSTCAVYGEPEVVPIPEGHAQRPTNAYGWSKLMLEAMLRGFDEAFGFRSVALRYFNAAGATAARGEHHEPESHLIPIVLEAALGRRSHVSIFGTDYPTPDGTAIRDYVHVADLGQAHLLALDHLRAGGGSESLNLGTGIGHSVREVVEVAQRVTGRPVATRDEPRRAGDPARLVADARRARESLGWRPQRAALEEIVRSAWEWRQRRPNGYA